MGRLPLLVVNLPILVYGFLTNLYPINILPVLALAVLLWLVLFGVHMKKGADFVWLSVITLFGVINPIYGNLVFEPFIYFLIIFTAATFWGIWLDKKINPMSNKYYSWYYGERMEKEKIYGERIPYLVVISAALIAAVII
jgi:hypothetical protein